MRMMISSVVLSMLNPPLATSEPRTRTLFRHPNRRRFYSVPPSQNRASATEV
jgi:hypothetical protein